MRGDTMRCDELVREVFVDLLLRSDTTLRDRELKILPSTCHDGMLQKRRLLHICLHMGHHSHQTS